MKYTDVKKLRHEMSQNKNSWYKMLTFKIMKFHIMVFSCQSRDMECHDILKLSKSLYGTCRYTKSWYLILRRTKVVKEMTQNVIVKKSRHRMSRREITTWNVMTYNTITFYVMTCNIVTDMAWYTKSWHEISWCRYVRGKDLTKRGKGRLKRSCNDEIRTAVGHRGIKWEEMGNLTKDGRK